MNVVDIAKVCHEANRALCDSLGDTSQKSWEEAEQWQRDASIEGVSDRIANPDAPVSKQHDSWVAAKIRDGWRFGRIKDGRLKTHPLLIPYDKLSEGDKAKDALFVAVVNALRNTL